MRPHRYSNVAVMGVPFPGATFGSNFTTSQYQLSGAVYGDPSLIPGWTFTRASTGYAETVAGTLTSFASGAPRITDKGLLVEEARTNLCLQSQALATTPWASGAAGTGVATVVTNNYALAPDGTMTATRLQCSLGGGTTTGDNSYQAQALTGASCRGSFWVKTTDGSAKTIYMRGASATSVAVTGEWTRYTFDAGTLAGTTFAIGLRGGQTPTNSNTCDILVWGAQLEAGAFATSYIPTTTASATRAADTPKLAGLLFPAPVTLVIAATIPPGVSTDGRITLSDGTTTNRLYTRYNGTNVLTEQYGNNVAASSGLTVKSAGQSLKAAVSFDGTTARFATDGTAAASSAGTAFTASLSQLEFMNAGGGRYWNGYIQRALIYPYAMSDAQLASATL